MILVNQDFCVEVNQNSPWFLGFLLAGRVVRYVRILRSSVRFNIRKSYLFMRVDASIDQSVAITGDPRGDIHG